MTDPDRYDLELCDGESGRCRAEMKVTRNGDWVESGAFDELLKAYNELEGKISEAQRALS